MPLWQSLEPGQIREKGPGDLVTEADLRSEARLTERLAALEPGSRVVGEEAVAADASVLDRLSDGGTVWVIDPVDGTANFAKGSPNFAIIVARVVDGETVQAWISAPALGQLAVGERGAGVTVNGQPPQPRPNGEGYTGFAVGRWRRAVDADPSRFAAITPSSSAGYEYLQLLQGKADFSAYSRLMPWDHAGGAMLIQAAGGTSKLLGDQSYSPRIHQGELLSTMRPGVWEELRDFFVGSASCP